MILANIIKENNKILSVKRKNSQIIINDDKVYQFKYVGVAIKVAKKSKMVYKYLNKKFLNA